MLGQETSSWDSLWRKSRRKGSRGWSGKWGLWEESRRQEGRMDTVTQKSTKVRAMSGRDKATKETAVKAAQLSSSDTLSSLGRKGRENN